MPNIYKRKNQATYSGAHAYKYQSKPGSHALSVYKSKQCIKVTLAAKVCKHIYIHTCRQQPDRCKRRNYAFRPERCIQVKPTANRYHIHTHTHTCVQVKVNIIWQIPDL